jgi:hypothetical protein
VPVTVELPDVATFSPQDFERAWRLETAIVIRRNAPNDVQDRQIYVWVDGEPLGKIRYGGAISCPIEPGPHTVRVFNTLMSQTITVDAAPGEQVRVQCGTGMPMAGWLMLIFLHVTFLRVWVAREP